MTGLWGRLGPNFRGDRARPPLAELAAETDSERFVWRMLPHAARSFSPAIAVLPSRLARPLAAAYLWCRALDTTEDLSPDGETRRAGFAACVEAAAGCGDLRLPRSQLVQDDRDRAHWLIVEKAPLLSAFTAGLRADSRLRIAELVRGMAEGMELAAERRAASGGVLASGTPREEYCRAVLAAPLVYAEAELRAQNGDPAMDDARRRLAMAAGEIIQLANVCRDVEKDLRRRTAYDEVLRPYLDAGVAPAEVVAEVRTKILRRVAALGPVIEPYFGGLPLKGRPGARAAAAVMCGATASFYGKANRRLPTPVLAPTRTRGRGGLAFDALRAACSLSGAKAVFSRAAAGFVAASLDVRPGPVECRTL